jgi:RHS repeat-associated protein
LTENAAGDVTNRYLHGPAIDQILADEALDNSGNSSDVLWPLVDNLGSVRNLADYDAPTDTTTNVNHLVYDAYGNLTETAPAVDHIFGFTGRERDEESDLYYNRARYYDPALGNWISEDPIGFQAGDTNLNRYVGNNPTNATDPSGLDYIKVDKNNIVSWVVEMDDWGNSDVREFTVGTVKDGVVSLTASSGGGRVMLSKLETQADRYWRDFGDMGSARSGVQRMNINNAIAQIKKGRGVISTDSAAMHMMKESGQGVK